MVAACTISYSVDPMDVYVQMYVYLQVNYIHEIGGFTCILHVHVHVHTCTCNYKLLYRGYRYRYV